MGFVFALVTEDGADAENDSSQQPAEQFHTDILVRARDDHTPGPATPGTTANEPEPQVPRW